MSKNLTRKGLALGAIVALGSTFFAGASAFAAGTASDGITLAPNAGTTYSTIAGSKFDLANTALSGALQTQYGSTSAAKLSFLVTNAGEASLKFNFNAASADAVNDYTAFTGTSAATVTSAGTVANTTPSAAKAIVLTGSTNDQGVNTGNVAGLKNHLIITSDATATANVSVDVQAFFDENGNGKIDTGDLVSPVRTVTFVPVASISASTTVTSAVIGSSKLQATVSFDDANINAANIPAGDIVVQFKENGAAVTVDGTDHPTASWDTTDLVTRNNGTLVAGNTQPVTGNPVTNKVQAATYTAQAYFKSVSAANKLGSAGGAITPVAGTDASVDSVDVVETAGSANSAKISTGVGIVRAGFTGAVTFKSVVTNAGSALKVAGNTVKVTLTAGSTFDSTSSFVAGGKTLTSTSGAQSFTTTTDADGKISFTGASSTGKSGDVVDIAVAALTKNSGYVSAPSHTLVTYTTAVASSLIPANVIGSGAVLKSTIGGTLNLKFVLADQFSQPIPTGTYRASISAVDTTTQVNQSYLTNGVAGVFTQAFVDNSTKAGNYTVTASVYKYDATALTWGGSAIFSDTSTVVYVNATAAATVSASATATPSGTTVATDATAVSAVDLRLDANSQSAPAYGSAYYTVSGTVADSNGAPVAGAVVTLTGAGLGFKVNANVYTVGSATVNANSSGFYSALVYSNVAGKTSVVVTSGAATKSAALEFTGVTTLDKKGTIALDVVSLSQVGRAITVSAVVKDSLGNPVKATGALKFSLTGVGSLSSSAAVDTDAAGLATVQFLAGANDFGDAVITAKYTVTVAGVDTVVSATKTVTVGVTDAQVDIVNNRVTAVSSFTKGRTVAFYVDGVKKWSKLSASDADVVVNYNLKKGAHTVTVKISGGFVTTEKFIVK